MADEKPKTAAPRTAENIAVSTLTLADPIKGIGRDNLRNVVALVKGATKWEITYIPHMRHHRIDYTNGAGGSAVVKTKFVHETRVSDWEPVA